mgnify:CR=1 FL=1
MRYVPVPDDAVNAFFATAYERAPAVRRLLDAAGLDPRALPPPAQWLERLPVMTKEELSARQQAEPPFGGWVAGGVQAVRRVFVSPGPIYNVEGTEPDDWGTAEAVRAAGFGPGDLVLNTFSYHLSPASFMVESGLRAVGAAVIPAGTAAKAEQVRLLRQLPVTGYAGVPSYLKALLDELAASGEPQPGGGSGRPAALPLRRAWLAAERLPEELRREFQERWGIEAYQGYGTAEVGIVAFECTVRQGWHLGGRAVVEILDPETRRPVPEGETGEVVVTPLRAAYPLLRLATGDLSRVLPGACPCGRRSPRLAGVLGRVGSGVKVRGMFVYPHQIEELARAVPGIARLVARVSQENYRDWLELAAEPAGEGPGERETELARRLEEAARDRLRLRPDAVRVVGPGQLAGQPLLADQRR